MPPTPPPAPEVELVVVEAPRLPPLGGEAVFAVEQLDAQALKTAPRLDAALKRVPEASLFRRTGSDGANPTIQGVSLRAIAPSGAGRALVTLDGVPQGDPFGGWVIWSALPPEALESVTIIKGAGAGAYGAGALTGTIALRERPALDGLSALDISAGERGEERAVAVLGTRGLLITAAGESSGGYTPVRGARRGAADTSANLGSASLSARLQGELAGISTAFRLSGYEERRGAGLAGSNSYATGGQAALTLAKLSDGGGWRLQAWAQRSDLANSSASVNSGRVSTTPANNQLSSPALGYGLNAALQGRLAAWSWEVGADFRFAQGVEHEQFRYLSGAFTRGRDAGGRTSVAGIYAETARDLGDLLLTGGVRVDAWSETGAKRVERDLSTGAITLDSHAPDSSGVAPTGRFGARWRLSDAVWVRGAAYAGFRPPTLNELHRPFRVGNDVTEANPTLRPEKLYGVETGIGGDGPIRWSGTVFYNWLDDPITNVTVGLGPATFPIAGFIPAGGSLRQRQNAGRIDAYGLEGDISRSFGALELNGAFAATHARVDGGGAAPQLTGLRPAQTPELTVTAGASWRVGDRLTLSGQARYESARFEDDQNTRRLAPGTSLDGRAAWRIAPDAELYLAAENLTDAKIQVGQTGDGVISLGAPRTFRVGYALRR